MSLNLNAITSPAPLVYVKSVESTMDLATQMARSGEPHLTAVVAEEQTKGRGRLGRVWQTFPHTSIAATFIIKTGVGEQLPLVAAVAVAEAIADATGGIMPAIKWPNDLLLGGKKIAGLLVETIEVEGERIALLGIGINVNTPEDGIRDDFVGTTIENHLNRSIPRAEVMQQLINHLSKSLHIYEQGGFAVFHEHYSELCATLGQTVVWNKDQPNQVTGTATAINKSGALTLKLANGSEQLITSGEIIANA